MSYFINGIKTTKRKLLNWINDPKTTIQQITVELPNENKSNGPPTMEGFSVPAEFLISMAEQSDEMNAEITATFSGCGKLGGKTVVIKVG